MLHEEVDILFYHHFTYVDDILVGPTYGRINKLKKRLSKEFEIRELGASKKIIGMRIVIDTVTSILKKFYIEVHPQSIIEVHHGKCLGEMYTSWKS